MPLGGASGDGGVAQQEAQRQRQLNKGMGQINDLFSKYGDDFYNQRATDYTNYATPQMMENYRATKNKLAYALARNGLLNSSAATADDAALNRTLNANTNQIANEAQDQANQLRQQVQNSRNTLTSELIASGSPSTVSENANAATAGLAAPPAFGPLGNMFSDFAGTYLTNMNARAYNPQVPSLWGMFSGGF